MGAPPEVEEEQPSFQCPPVQDLRACIVDVKQPIGKRTHAAFYLRTLGSAEAVDAIADSLSNADDSALLRHELAYILGQMRNPRACQVLVKILMDASDDCMVRHEAAEALGAIGSKESVPVLQQYSQDPVPEVSQTCQLALDLIAWREANDDGDAAPGDLGDVNPYLSVDPAPGKGLAATVEDLRQQLRDQTKSLFYRYRAMFSLRNRGSPEAVLALCDGFEGEDNSLFKHEVAYVLGQLQHPVSVPALIKVLADDSEHRMVRHEAAEALGAIGGSEAEAVLERFRHDPAVVVSESCQVALDTIDYWQDTAL